MTNQHTEQKEHCNFPDCTCPFDWDEKVGCPLGKETEQEAKNRDLHNLARSVGK